MALLIYSGINIYNWFKDSKAAWQHNKNAILRAVENDRYIARTANTGISCIIDNKGRVVEELGLLERKYLNGYIKKITKKTLYSTTGDLIIYIDVIFIILIIIKIS